MTKEEITFDQQTFSFDKADSQWVLTLKRSDIATQAVEQVRLLEMEHPLLLPQTSRWDKETVTFTYTIEENGISYDSLKAMRLSEKIRAALNITDLADCLTLPITFFIDPANLFFTKNGMAKIAYRALPEIMKPDSLSEQDFLRQVKCTILTLFTDHHFEDLYQGALEIIKDIPPFLEEVVATDSLAQLRTNLTKSFEEVLADENATLSLVPRRKYKRFKYLTIWFSALSVVLTVPLVYIIFLQMPFQQKMLDADREFLKLNYSAVASTLKSVDLNRMPFTQKYELAYSYVQNLNFSDEQRSAVLNNISLKSDELLLDYWIEIGRANNDEAMDISIRLEDYDLIIYAIAQKIEEVKNDSSLSGSEREEQLESLQSDYETYNEERQAAINGGDDESDASSSSSGK